MKRTYVQGPASAQLSGCWQYCWQQRYCPRERSTPGGASPVSSFSPLSSCPFCSVFWCLGSACTAHVVQTAGWSHPPKLRTNPAEHGSQQEGCYICSWQRDGGGWYPAVGTTQFHGPQMVPHTDAFYALFLCRCTSMGFKQVSSVGVDVGVNPCWLMTDKNPSSIISCVCGDLALHYVAYGMTGAWPLKHA